MLVLNLKFIIFTILQKRFKIKNRMELMNKIYMYYSSIKLKNII